MFLHRFVWVQIQCNELLGLQTVLTSFFFLTVPPKSNNVHCSLKPHKQALLSAHNMLRASLNHGCVAPSSWFSLNSLRSRLRKSTNNKKRTPSSITGCLHSESSFSVTFVARGSLHRIQNVTFSATHSTLSNHNNFPHNLSKNACFSAASPLCCFSTSSELPPPSPHSTTTPSDPPTSSSANSKTPLPSAAITKTTTTTTTSAAKDSQTEEG